MRRTVERAGSESDSGWEEDDRESSRLVRDLQAGTDGAFEELYLRYFDRVYSYLRLAIKDESEAEDAAQQVFMKALETIPKSTFEARKPVRAWLFTVARNTALDHWRRQGKVQPAAPESLDRRQEEAGTETAAVDRLREEPELRALRWLTDRDLTVLIERIPEPQRQVLFLRYVADFDLTEIAHLLGRKPESVRQLHHRALRFLEQRLAAVGREPSDKGRHPMRARRWRGALRPAHAFSIGR